MVGKTGIDEPVETLVALVVEKGANVAERLRGKAILVCQFTICLLYTSDAADD